MFFELSHVKFLKKTTVFTRRATEKMTTIFTQNDNFDHFEWIRCHFVHFLRLHQHLYAWDNSQKNQQRNRGPKAAKMGAKSHPLSTIHICLYVHKDKILWGLIWYIPIFEDVSQNKKNFLRLSHLYRELAFRPGPTKTPSHWSWNKSLCLWHLWCLFYINSLFEDS